MTTGQKGASLAAILTALVIAWIVAGKVGGSMPVAWPPNCRTHDSVSVFTESTDSAKAVIKKGGISYVPARGTPERMALDTAGYLPVGDSMRLVMFCRDSLPLKPHL